MRRSVAAGRRLLSAALLVGFVVGIPVLLHRFGSPLPARWPAWSRFVTDVRIGYVPSSVPAKFALVAGWAAWAFLAYEIVAETVIRLRRHASRRSSVLGPLQPVLSKLVAAVVLSTPVIGRGVAVASEPVVLSSTVTGQVLSPASLAPDVPAPATLATLPTYVVQAHDSLWGIAERYLGNPLRWSEIAALNEGRVEGSAAFGDPHWIYPGWTLVLPSDAKGLGAQTDSEVSAAEPEPPPTDQAPQPPEVSPGGPASTREDTGPGNASSSERHGRAAPRAVAMHSLGQGRSNHSRRTEDSKRVHTSVPVAPVGLGLLAAGVLAVIDRLRRIQQRRRPRGVRIKLPEADLAELERDFRAHADPALLSDVDLGLRLLASTLRAFDQSGAELILVAIRCRPDRFEFVLDGHAAPGAPVPFVQAENAVSTWILARDWRESQTSEYLAQLAAVDPPTPALVTVGTESGDELLVNLEHLGSLSVTGTDAGMVLQGMVVELATVPWGDHVDVVVVGHPNELIGLERTRRAPSLAAAVATVRQRLAEQQQLLQEAGVGSAAQARRNQDMDSSDLLVVVGLPPVADAETEATHRLTDLISDGSAGVVVLLGGDAPARWRLETDGGRMNLQGPDAAAASSGADWTDDDGTLLPQRVPPDLLSGVDALLDVATDATGADIDRPKEFGLRSGPRGTSSSQDPFPDDAQDYEIEVKVLGPVEVTGIARPFTRAWALELVVYLALHPDRGATTDSWSEALWPGRLIAAPTLHSTASAARRSLGVSAAGTDHLPRAHGRLCLGPGVTSDWVRLQSLAALDTPDSRRAALRLVRGRLFEGLRSSDWTILEGITASIEAVVVDLALRHAEDCVDSDPSGAEWAARQGLRVSQYDERLYRVLLRAADAAGHPAGVESAMEELVRLVADDLEPYDSIHPETLDLYRRLSRRSGARRGA